MERVWRIGQRSTKATSKAASKAARLATDDAAYAKQKMMEALGKGGPDLARGQAEMAEYGIKSGKGESEGQMSQRQINIYRKNLKKRVGIAKNMNRQQRRDFEAFLRRQEIALKASTGRMQGSWTVMTTGMKAATASLEAAWKGAMARMSMAVNWLAKQANRAMRLMGWVGVALMIFEAGKALYEWIAGTDEAAEREKKWLDTTKQKYEGLNEELDNMVKKSKQLTHDQYLIQTGNLLQSANLTKLIADYNEAAGKSGPINEELKKQFRGIAVEVDRATGGRGKSLIQAIDSEKQIKMEQVEVNGVLINQYDTEIQQIMDLANVYISGSQAASKFAQTSRALSQAIQGQIKGTKKLAFSDIRGIYAGYLNEANAINSASKEIIKTRFGDKGVTVGDDGTINTGIYASGGKQQAEVASAIMGRQREGAALAEYRLLRDEMTRTGQETITSKAGHVLTMDQLNYSIDYSVNALKRYNNVLENSNDPLAQALKEHEIKLELTEKRYRVSRKT